MVHDSESLALSHEPRHELIGVHLRDNTGMRFLAAVCLLTFSVCAETVRIQVLATTDLHGNLLPWDYFTGKPAPRGLAPLATLIREQRKANPNTLLLDNGDTIQGTPVESLHQAAVRDGGVTRPDPMMAAMNALGYDAMTVGNHEFNFGLGVLNRARNEATFPWLSGNTVASGDARPFEPYILKTVGGVRIGVFGITTPNIPNWEQPENYQGYSFRDGAEASRDLVQKLRGEKADLIIGLVHAGLGPKGRQSHENMADRIARDVPGIDAIIFGHTHQQTADLRINGVLMTQPGRWGERLSVIDFELEKEGNAWRVTSKTARLLNVAKTPADAEIARIAEPYHRDTEKWLDTAVATAPATLDGKFGRVQDTAIVDAVHAVQLHYAEAQVSFTSLFNPRVRIEAGPVTVRQIAAVYLYDNELYAIDGTGNTIKSALENAAAFYLQCPEPSCRKGPLTDWNKPGYNFDMAQGVEYEVDLSRPVGDRIRNLTYGGQPIRAEQMFRIAVNNYRAAGSNGYIMFKTAPVVWKSNRSIRDLVIEYYAERKRLPAAPDNNWRIVPEAARKVLEAEAAKP
jgi:2',3'-cyclic-nucleotide 2'-phosphodiesterase/3'-nucleotidase